VYPAWDAIRTVQFAGFKTLIVPHFYAAAPRARP
jgi:hypothetical protein